MDKEEKEVIDELEDDINEALEENEDIFDTFILFNIKSAKTVLKLINKYEKRITFLRGEIYRLNKKTDKLQKENENAKWYINQMIARINEDIADYIDDDKEGNKNIIGELKETRKQWQDVEELLNGESKDNLYNDWRKYGEYEWRRNI